MQAFKFNILHDFWSAFKKEVLLGIYILLERKKSLLSISEHANLLFLTLNWCSAESSYFIWYYATDMIYTSYFMLHNFILSYFILHTYFIPTVGRETGDC